MPNAVQRFFCWVKTQSKLEVVYDEIEALGLALPAILPMDLERADFAQMQKLAGLIEKNLGILMACYIMQPFWGH